MCTDQSAPGRKSRCKLYINVNLAPIKARFLVSHQPAGGRSFFIIHYETARARGLIIDRKLIFTALTTRAQHATS